MRHSITLADLQARFHLPLTEAAKSLGICATILKKVSRAFGVRRWPHRGLKRLHGTLALMEESLNSPGDGDPQLKAQLEREHDVRSKACVVCGRREESCLACLSISFVC